MDLYGQFLNWGCFPQHVSFKQRAFGNSFFCGGTSANRKIRLRGKTRSWTMIVFSLSLSVSSMRVYDFKLSNHAGNSHLYI